MTDPQIGAPDPAAFLGFGSWPEAPAPLPRAATSPPLPALDHVGIVVTDLASAAEDFERWWGATVIEVGELTLRDALCFGRPADVVMRRAFIDHQGTDIELIQPLPSSSPSGSSLHDRRGEGVHHLAYVVKDIDRHLARLRPVGSELALDAQLPDGHGRIVQIRGFAHGPCIELIQPGGKCSLVRELDGASDAITHERPR